MLIKITNFCTMQCSHCMNSSSTKLGTDMTTRTFRQSIDLANRLGSKVILISGGEPTEHPRFGEFLEYAQENFKGLQILVTTHGHYIETQSFAESTKWFRMFPEVMFQITNDKRYYPKQISESVANVITKKFPNVHIFWEIGGHLYPQGRALRYEKVTAKSSKSMGTKCFNLRSMCNNNQFSTLPQVVQQMEMMGKFCTPSVNWDGSVMMGESSLCPPIGSVNTVEKFLFDNIKNSQCNDCQMLNKLTPLHLNAIRYVKVKK